MGLTLNMRLKQTNEDKKNAKSLQTHHFDVWHHGKWLCTQCTALSANAACAMNPWICINKPYDGFLLVIWKLYQQQKKCTDFPRFQI